MIMKTIKATLIGVLTASVLMFSPFTKDVKACTGISLSGADRGVVVGRTMEWGAFDLHSRVTIIPRGHHFVGLTPDGYTGKKWRAKYGVVGLDMLEKVTIADGMNEKGLYAGLFYHPGFAKYPKYNPKNSNSTITAIDVVHFILTQFGTTDEVKKGMEGVRVVPVIEKSLGIPVEAHFLVEDAQGKAIVIEFTKGETIIYDNPLGVITNSPNFDWHMINLRNYVNLSPVAIPAKKIENIDFSALGGGSGMMGLPGDFTPPSRFVRAVAFSQIARPTATSGETVYELFRMLDNFNLGLGSAEGSDLSKDVDKLRSATLWTTAWDTKEKVLYYHTQHNRRVRKVNLNHVDFTRKDISYLPLDIKKEQDIQDITPRK